MSSKSQGIQEKLQRLRQQYAERLPERITALEQQWQALIQNPQAVEFENLIREFHSLAGSGTSFGFPLITSLSREIESTLLEAKSINYQLSEQHISKVKANLSSLKQAASEGQETANEGTGSS